MSIKNREISEWISHRKLSENTERIYRMELDRFMSWLGQNGDPLLGCTKENVLGYFERLRFPPEDSRSGFFIRHRKALSASSLEQSRRILFAFFEWSVRKQLRPTNPLWGVTAMEIQGKESQAPMLPKSTIAEVADMAGDILTVNPEDIDGDEREVRVAVISHLAFWGGVTPKEVVSLNVDDFVFHDDMAYIKLPVKDGGKNVPLPENTAAVLKHYLSITQRYRRVDADGKTPLIRSLRDGKRITGWAVTNSIRKWGMERIPIDEGGIVLTPRGIRRAFIEMAICEGAQERVVAARFRRKRLQFSPTASQVINEEQLLLTVRMHIKSNKGLNVDHRTRTVEGRLR